MTDPRPAFELPTELEIDTDVARRIIGEFIRAQLQQAGFERLVLGLSGGIDSALVAYLAATRPDIQAEQQPHLTSKGPADRQPRADPETETV